MNKIASELLRIARNMEASSAEAEIERLMKAILPSSIWKGRVMAVGGYVRDQLLGLDAKDLDLVVEGEGGAKEFTHWIKNQFGNEVSTPRQLGAGYPIWQITFKEDIEFDGEVYETKGGELEVSDSQKESFPDEDSRQRVTTPGSIADDVERRDFTVNMLMKDLSSGELVDLTGTSVSDIQNGILRGHPGVDFNKILRDDPLRMMRLIRFQAKYGWKVPLSVLKIVKANAGRIAIVSAERVREELVKVMKIGKLAQAVRAMSVVGLLKHILPEVEALKGVEQTNKGGWHQEGDVFRHTLMVLKGAKPGVESQMAALLHDIGKPATQERFGEFVKFIGHEVAGGEMAEAMMRRMKFDNAAVSKVRKLVENHMRPHSLGRMNEGVSEKSIRKFVREVGEELVDAVLDLAEADSLGTIPSHNEIPDLRERIEDAVKDAPVGGKPILDGRDVMRILGVKPGKDVGRAMGIVQDIMDDAAVKRIPLDKDLAERELLKRWEA